MTLSDRERQVLAELARQLEEQDPELAWALGDAERRARHLVRGRQELVRWRERVRVSQRAPLRIAVAGGALFVAGLMVGGSYSGDPGPGPGGQVEMPVFAEQQLDR